MKHKGDDVVWGHVDRLCASLALYSALFARFSVFQCVAPVRVIAHFQYKFTQGMRTPLRKIIARAHLCDQQQCIRTPWLHRPRRRSCMHARSSILHSNVYQNQLQTRFYFHCVRASAQQVAALLPSPLPANHMAVARHAP